MYRPEGGTLPPPPTIPAVVLQRRDRLIGDAAAAERAANLLREDKLASRSNVAESAALLDGYARGLRSVAAVVYQLWHPRSGGIG